MNDVCGYRKKQKKWKIKKQSENRIIRYVQNLFEQEGCFKTVRAGFYRSNTLNKKVMAMEIKPY